MSTEHQRKQRLIRRYKDETGIREVNMHEVAKFAIKIGWELPTPKNPIDLFAAELSRAAREEIKYDKKTGRPYRVNHAYKEKGHQFSLWIDIDEAPRKPMFKSLMNRRDQMIGDGLHLTYDADHWNSIHEDEEPIDIPLDFTDDIEWRKNGPEEKAG